MERHLLLSALITISMFIASISKGQGFKPVQDKEAAQTKLGSEPPTEQKQFCALVADYRDMQNRYSQETNPIRKAGMLQPNPLRYEEQEKSFFAPHNQFANWVGVIHFSVVGKSVSVTFFPYCSAAQQSIQFSNATSTPSGLMTGMPPEDMQTVIQLNSPIATALQNATTYNQRVTVSGNLVAYSALTKLSGLMNTNRYAAARTYYKSRAGGAGASVAMPNYLVKFASITLLPDKPEPLPRME
jgi:hypothetical protein